MMNTLAVVISIASSVVSAMLVFALQGAIREIIKSKNQKDEATSEFNEALENGVRQLLSVHLEELYDRYADCETISIRAYSRWKKLHTAYKGLHGNGTFDHMAEEIENKRMTNETTE